MKIKRSCKISLTLLGLSTLFITGCDNGSSIEQKKAWLMEQETKAADSLTPQEREAAEWEYNNWTPEEKAGREQASRERGYRDDPRLPWWVYWMIFNSLMSPYNTYTGSGPRTITRPPSRVTSDGLLRDPVADSPQVAVALMGAARQ